MAYLSEFLERSVPIFGLVRTSFGYVLLDRAGLCEIKSKLCGTVLFAGIDALSRLPRGLTKTQRQALTEVRKWSIARSTPRKFERMLAENLPPKTSYINVGHSNITDRVFAGIKDALHGQISVMIHDVIPLDFPEFTTLKSKPQHKAPTNATTRCLVLIAGDRLCVRRRKLSCLASLGFCQDCIDCCRIRVGA